MMIVFIMIMPTIAFAQIKNSISVEKRGIHKQGNILTVDLDILLQDLQLPSNSYVTLTPVLKNNTGQNQELPLVILNGKTSQKRYDRSVNLNGQLVNAYRVVRMSGKNNKEVIPYRTDIPYQAWMENADVVLVGKTCDCGDPAEQFEIPIDNLTPVVFPTFINTFITPPVEAIKNRELTGEAFVIFPVNKTILQPELANNASELQKIRTSFDYVRDEKDIIINAITIEAYASPEGPLNNNIRLAEGRATALKDYIISLYGIENKLISVQSKGENWDGLIDAVEKSNFTDKQKQEILDIINISDLNTRKSKLKSYDRGQPYQQLLTNIYPNLRKSIYKIYYEVPAFSLEKAKEILKTKPGMLSLNELYTIANTYDKKSDDFKKVFDIAIRLYPKDPIANMNAASIELEKNNTAEARKYLAPYMNNEQAYNNIGILYAQEGHLDEAQRYFKMAADTGDKNAIENLQSLVVYRQKSDK